MVADRFSSPTPNRIVKLFATPNLVRRRRIDSRYLGYTGTINKRGQSQGN